MADPNLINTDYKIIEWLMGLVVGAYAFIMKNLFSRQASLEAALKEKADVIDVDRHTEHIIKIYERLEQNSKTLVKIDTKLDFIFPLVKADREQKNGD